jgi:hypothetical protein
MKINGNLQAANFRGVPDYSACTMYYDFNESAPPYANKGSAGTLNLSKYSDAVVEAREGIHGLGAGLLNISSDNKGLLRTAATSVGESNSLGVFLWLKQNYHPSYSMIIGKNYYVDDAGSAPYFAWNIRLITSGSNVWEVDVCTSGSTNALTISNSADYIELDQWVHIGFTYDASTGVLTAYKNGWAVKTTTVSAANIDYGTHGTYVVGADYQYGPRQVYGRIDELRMYSTLPSSDDIMALYRAWLG